MTLILIITFLQPAITVIDEEAYYGDARVTEVKIWSYLDKLFP